MNLCDAINCDYCHAGEADNRPHEHEEEEVENGEGFFACPVCGVLNDGVGICYNCGYDPDEDAPGDFREDWTRPNNQPYEEEDTDDC